MHYYIEPVTILQFRFHLSPRLPHLLPHSLYIHIPFCTTKCTYCAFNTYVDLERLIPNYIEALITELKIVSYHRTIPIKTIFFGGGTPSLISPIDYERIFTTINQHFSVKESAEISLEANPNDLPIDYLRDLRQVGFNRISIGMQSAHESELRLFDRRHNAEIVEQAVTFARQADFANINLDLIYGSPYQTLNDWEFTLQTALNLSPEHISLYALELKGGTPLREWVEQGEVEEPEDDLTADMYDLATEMLAGAGLEQYEISNWCKPRYECQHNLQYWHNLPYLGVGAGAEGFAGGYRYSTIRLPQRYITSLQTPDNATLEFPKTPAVAKAIKLDAETEKDETILMGLRLTRDGINREQFQSRFGSDFYDDYQATIDKFVGYDIVEVTSDRVKLTQAGRFLSNALIRELLYDQ